MNIIIKIKKKGGSIWQKLKMKEKAILGQC